MTVVYIISISVFLIALVSVNCGLVSEGNGTAAEDVDGHTLVKLGRQLNIPMLTLLGIAIKNLHPCAEWTQWSECQATRANYFGTRNRTRTCGVHKGRDGATITTDMDLGICEGGMDVCFKEYKLTTNGFCIKLHVAKKDHDEAEAQCEQDGGHLINIDSELKYGDVKTLLNGLFVPNVHLGGQRRDSNSPWEYNYGSISGFFKWYSGYPHTNTGTCLAFQGVLWWNLPCKTKYPFLCEIII